jgi:hypothetical protein
MMSKKKRDAAKVLAEIDAKVAAIPPDEMKAFLLAMQAESERPYDPAPDTELALRWLEGYEDTDERGLPVQRYLTGDEEWDAKFALKALLQSDAPLDRRMRRAIADKLDLPLRIAPRLRGNRAYYLAHELWQQSRSVPLEEAAKEIAEEYGISERTVWRAWSEYNDNWPSIWEKFKD